VASKQQVTRCPHCQTAFRVNQLQLEAASGMVRCGKCLTVFNGLDSLVPTTLPSRDPEVTPTKSIDLDNDFLIDDNFDVSLLEKLGNPEQAPLANNDSRDVKTETQPYTHSAPPETAQEVNYTLPDTNVHGDSDSFENISFTSGNSMSTLTEELDELELDNRVMSKWRPETHNIIPDAGLLGRQPKARKTIYTWLWFVATLIAISVLSLQLIYFNSLLISRNSPLWTLSSTVCPILGCPLPTTVDMDKILSTDLIIRSHPYTEDALLVDAVIINTAEFDQPFPPLTLAFEDLQGSAVAKRTFITKEYLLGELAGLTQMPSKQPVKIELEIVDPGKDAVSFRLFIDK